MTKKEAHEKGMYHLKEALKWFAFSGDSPVGLRKTNGLSHRDTKALFAELQRRAK